MAKVLRDRGWAVVVDVGKTNSKLTCWSRDGRMLDRQMRSNTQPAANGYKPLDTTGVQNWILDSLAAYAGSGVEYIIPVAHGAALAAVRNDRLLFAPVDYEWEAPADKLEAYRSTRDAFTLTGSPALPAGLNIGTQLHWLDEAGMLDGDGTILMPYAQYWAWMLSGKASSEVTSLGCHSDIWDPAAGVFSPMARRRGWADKFAPPARASDVVGTLRAEIAEQTGLSPQTKVLAGLHDSNAALLAARGFDEVEQGEATVLSTGTWFISMRLAGQEVSPAILPESRDCLMNVDAYGHPVPSARFMGGREIETLIEIDTRRVDIKPDQPALLHAVSGVVERGAMVVPTLVPGTGPFPDAQGGWVNRPDDWYARRSAACLYGALMTDAAMSLIGSRNLLLVEGRFAEAEVFVRALASLRPDMTVYVTNAHNDVSFGALRLIDPSLKPEATLTQVDPLNTDLAEYRSTWAEAIQ